VADEADREQRNAIRNPAGHPVVDRAVRDLDREYQGKPDGGDAIEKPRGEVLAGIQERIHAVVEGGEQAAAVRTEEKWECPDRDCEADVAPTHVA